MIKHVIFDLGGVLIDLDMPRCLEEFRALGADPEVLLRRPEPADAGSGKAKATLCDGLVANGAMDLYQTGDALIVKSSFVYHEFQLLGQLDLGLVLLDRQQELHISSFL